MLRKLRIRWCLRFLLMPTLMVMIIIMQYTSKEIEEPSIAIYRILGNDLPPRHSVNQTLNNLRFILEREPAFEKVQKIWFLNRIVNQDREREFIHLLKQYNRSYIRIPFVWDEYRRIPYHFPLNRTLEKFINSKKYSELHELNKIRVMDTIYYSKNLYVMNSNKARNMALEHGKQQNQARWLMILDSNCFVSHEGFAEIRKALMTNGSRIQYFIVPMIRLTDNNDAFHPPKIEAREEPQIIFRRDSTIEYLETIRYGRGPKLEMLFHLGVIEQFWASFPWEPRGRQPLQTSENNSNALFQYAGFVFRLYSHSQPNHEQWEGSRACSRLYGVFLFLENLELQLRRPKLLPAIPRMNATQCTAWSKTEMLEIIKTARKMNVADP